MAAAQRPGRWHVASMIGKPGYRVQRFNGEHAEVHRDADGPISYDTFEEAQAVAREKNAAGASAGDQQ